jgi:hypothetical protein
VTDGRDGAFPEAMLEGAPPALRAWWRRAWERDGGARLALHQLTERLMAVVRAGGDPAADAELARLKTQAFDAARRYAARTLDRMPPGRA